MIDWIKSTLFVCAVVGLPIFGLYSCQQSEWWQAGERAQAERERREATPHVVREADGCKVYAFKHGGDYAPASGRLTTASGAAGFLVRPTLALPWLPAEIE